MIKALKEIFSKGADSSGPDALHLADSILLLEVATADFKLSDSESDLLKSRLSQRFGLDAGLLDELVDEAMRQHDVAVSLHDQIAIINERFEPDQKRLLIRDMWSLAYADGELHHYEEAVIRRLADLLYIPHSEFIKAKHQVTGQP